MDPTHPKAMFQLLQIHKPKLSIILPTYNRADYLRQAIESVLVQSHRDFELIIINDGSVDTSEEIINSYADSRIVYVRQCNQGEYPATNTGLRMARGQFVTWIHSDDIMTPQSLADRVLCLNENQEVDLCHGDIGNIDEAGCVFRLVPAIDMDGLTAFLGYFKPESSRTNPNAVHHTTIMFRREFLGKVGFWDEQLPYAGDLDWLLRALKHAQIKKVPGTLYLYRHHATSRRQIDACNGVDCRAVVQSILERHAPRTNDAQLNSYNQTTPAQFRAT